MKVKRGLKIVGIILAVLIVLVLIHTIRNYVIITRLQENIQKYESSNNYSIKSVSSSNDMILTMDYYTKDNKKVLIMERNDHGKIVTMSTYDNGERKNIFWDIAETNEKRVQTNSEILLEINIYNGLENENKIQTFLASIFTKVRETEYKGKKCYIISGYMNSFDFDKSEKYIEKDTGLCIKSTDSLGQVEKEYEFNKVNDEIFMEPDISQYQIQENK